MDDGATNEEPHLYVQSRPQVISNYDKIACKWLGDVAELPGEGLMAFPTPSSGGMPAVHRPDGGGLSLSWALEDGSSMAQRIAPYGCEGVPQSWAVSQKYRGTVLSAHAGLGGLFSPFLQRNIPYERIACKIDSRFLTAKQIRGCKTAFF